jgi:AraC family transcriptional regulator
MDAEILVSRWSDPGTSSSHEFVSPPGRYVIGVALKTTQLRLMRDQHIIFDGTVRLGTVHVMGPAQSRTAKFRRPCDFIHFHVSSDYVRMCQDGTRPTLSRPIDNLNDLIIGDPLSEMLVRSLSEHGTSDGLYAKSIGQTLVMHIVRISLRRQMRSALPKWRLARVEEYVAAHSDKRISLADLAKVAGLSRMHFAAQFRAATGYRPHDFLLHHRIESAKAMLSEPGIPLAEIALAVGFQSQSHFSTVFKRLTGESPARWRNSISNVRWAPRTFPQSTRRTRQQHYNV